MNEYIEKSFAGLTSAFDTSFDMAEEKTIKTLVAETEHNLDLIEQKKNDIVSAKREVVLKDQTFLEEELKELIIGTKTMLAKLEAEIKIGTKSSFWDSYTKLASAVMGNLKELRELNVSVATIEMNKSKVNNDINTNKRISIVLDSNALIDLVNKATKDSQMNKIDASFTIDDKEKD